MEFWAIIRSVLRASPVKLTTRNLSETKIIGPGIARPYRGTIGDSDNVRSLKRGRLSIRTG